MAASQLPRYPRWSRTKLIATVMAFMVCLMGAINILSAWVGIEYTRLALLRHLLPLEINQGSRTLTVLAGLLLIWLSWSLQCRKRQGWIAATLVLAVSCILHLLKGFDYEEALCAATVLAGLLLTRQRFVVRSDPGSWRGAILAVLVILGGSLLSGVAGFALLHRHFTPAFSWYSALQSTWALLSLTTTPILHPVTGHRDAVWFTDSLITTGIITVLIIAGSLLRPVATAMHVLDHEREEVKRLLMAFGGHRWHIGCYCPVCITFFRRSDRPSLLIR